MVGAIAPRTMDVGPPFSILFPRENTWNSHSFSVDRSRPEEHSVAVASGSGGSHRRESQSGRRRRIPWDERGRP